MTAFSVLGARSIGLMAGQSSTRHGNLANDKKTVAEDR